MKNLEDSVIRTLDAFPKLVDDLGEVFGRINYILSVPHTAALEHERRVGSQGYPTEAGGVFATIKM
jgi:hypothetical protein